MARVNFVDIHRTWEDYLGMVLGVVIVLTPALTDGVSTAVMINAGIVGVAVFCLAGFELVDLRRWEEGLELLCGFWLIASPFVFGYADYGMLAIVHVAAGAMVALLALLELWQDWNATDRELEAHGH